MAVGSSKLLFFLALNLALITFNSAQNALLFPSSSDDRGNFTANSAYEANLNNLLSSFSSVPANDYGFYNMSVGQNSDRVNAIALCRGDINPDVCLSCINNATTELTNRCPNRMEAAIRYDYCMLRYSNRSILGVLESSVFVYMENTMSARNRSSFNKALSHLLFELIQRAGSGGSLRKFATGDVDDSDFQPIYALMQCTPDLSLQDCTICLDRSFQRIPQCCPGRRGGRVITTSCHLRFEMERFYSASADAPPPAPPLPPSPSPPPPPPASNETTNSTGNKNNTSRIVIAVVIPIATVVIIVLNRGRGFCRGHGVVSDADVM